MTAARATPSPDHLQLATRGPAPTTDVEPALVYGVVPFHGRYALLRAAHVEALADLLLRLRSRPRPHGRRDLRQIGPRRCSCRVCLLAGRASRQPPGV